MKKLVYVVQSEIMTGGVIEAQVIASLRAQCAVPGQPATRLIFLESASEVRKPNVRAKFKEFKSFWPEGNMSLVPFVGRFGGNDAPGRALALALWRERFTKNELIFHCRGPQTTLTAAVAQRLLKKGRIIFDVRGATPFETIHRLGYAWRENLSPAASRAWDVSLKLDHNAAQAADELFVVSPGLKRYVIKELNVLSERVTIVPSCVAGPSYNPHIREQVRRDWGITDDSPVLLYSGRFGTYRAPEQILRVFAAIRQIRPTALLVIFSYLNELEQVSELLAHHQIPPEAVRWEAHPRDEVLRRACAADVGLVFSEPALRYLYGFPIKVPEYLAAGLPIAVTATYEQIPDLVKEYDVGWVMGQSSEEHEIRALAEIICYDLSVKRAALCNNALNLCAEKFVWAYHIQAMRSAYQV